MSEVWRRATVEDDFVHGVEERGWTGGCRRGGGDGDFKTGAEEDARRAVRAEELAVDGGPVWDLG